jgi:dihydroorotate dehydrogenase (NAD+) catalytic subunit
MVDLSVELAGVTLQNPTIVASGILGVTASSAGFAVDHGAGAVTLKSCGLAPRSGHPGPVILPIPGGLLNAVGLSNPGATEVAQEIRAFKERFSAPVVASVFGRTEEEFAVVAQRVLEGGPDLLELNVSCPNVASEFGTPFGLDHEATARITAGVKRVAGKTPVFVKLSPQAQGIGQLARRCQDAGADGITAVNTAGPGMAIDIGCRRPILANGMGGLSGPALLPIAVRCVYEIACHVTIPIIGTGGITRARDAVEMILAGATAIGIGSAVATEGIEVFTLISNGLERYLKEHRVESLRDIRGAAHDW